MFAATVADNGSVTLPFRVWTDAFINDASLEFAPGAYGNLNPHPYKTFTDSIALIRPPADMPVAKSHLNCTQDIALARSLR